jgi:hypothetical protein
MNQRLASVIDRPNQYVFMSKTASRTAHFEVWAYQVNPLQVSVGDPIDLSKRLDGNQTVRFN